MVRITHLDLRQMTYSWSVWNRVCDYLSVISAQQYHFLRKLSKHNSDRSKECVSLFI